MPRDVSYDQTSDTEETVCGWHNQDILSLTSIEFFSDPESVLKKYGKHFSHTTIVFSSTEDIVKDEAKLYAEMQNGRPWSSFPLEWASSSYYHAMANRRFSQCIKLDAWTTLCVDNRSNSTVAHNLLYCVAERARKGDIAELEKSRLDKVRILSVYPLSLSPCWLLAIQFAAGVTGAWGDDAHLLKYNIVAFINAKEVEIDTVNRNNKTQRGFNNKVTGRLLCPMGFNYDDIMCIASI